MILEGTMKDKDFRELIFDAIRYDSLHGAHLVLHPIPGKEDEFLIF